jgi:hypothetical protein
MNIAYDHNHGSMIPYDMGMFNEFEGVSIA